VTLFVKICGLKAVRDVDAAVEAGANAIGFVFHEPSPRNIAPAAAADLAARLPVGVYSVVVTFSPSYRLVRDILAEFTPDFWQTDADDFDDMILPACVRRLPVFREPPRSAPPELLLFEGERSGAGLRADWAKAAQLACRTKLILAGGLNAETVGDAVRQVSPYGVDVSSGVESAPGRKDPKAITNFIATARAAARSFHVD
jgi:phosphoribosylanthranilate isomerase